MSDTATHRQPYVGDGEDGARRLATEPGNEQSHRPDTGRDGAAVLADAIRILTEAGRLRRPVVEQGDAGVHPTRTTPADWAEFVTLAVAGAAANIGGVEKALSGRPGSWEAECVRSMLLSTVGEDPAELARHRTEPLRVVLSPSELLADMGYSAVYDESQRILAEARSHHVWSYRFTEDRHWQPLQENAPAADFDEEGLGHPGFVMTVPRSEHDALLDELLSDRVTAVSELSWNDDPYAYGEELRAAAAARADQLGLHIEIVVDDEERWGGVKEEGDAPGEQIEQMIQEVVATTPLPWSGLLPRDYPTGPAAIVELERVAARLPHQRVAQ